MSRRRSIFKFKLKRDSLISISAVFLILLGILTFISFFAQAATASSFLQDGLNKLFGWVSILVPFILITLGLLFLGKAFSFIKFNTFLGLLLLLVSLSGLTHLIFYRGETGLELANLGQGGGLLGYFISHFLIKTFTFLGAFFVLSALLLISLLVLFNASLKGSMEILTRGLGLLPVIFRRLVLGAAEKGRRKTAVEPAAVKVAAVSGRREGAEVEEEEEVESKTLEVKVLPKILPEVKPAFEPVKKREEVKKVYEPGVFVEETVKNLPMESYIWEYPPLSILSEAKGAEANRGDVSGNAAVIEKTLESFGIKARVVEVNMGPAVTQYALESAQGTKIARIKNLQNDLAMALASPTGSVRIEAPIPGKSLIGVETPNLSPAMVNLRSILSSPQMQSNKGKLTVAMGLDVGGQPVLADLARMPHVLIAGSTGSGKSTLVHAMLATLLFRNSPEELKFILVDTKRVELTEYNDIPHLLAPVITEPEKVLSALKWAVAEMERRYRLFQNARARNIDSYNELSGFQALPYIVILVDEMADMMQMAPVEVEKVVCRLAQMARATGIHLVLSTQRPSVDVLTGLIKANIPARIAFNVTSQIDSRVIIDQSGAEKLLGRGDMLYLPPESSKPVRIQGVYVSPAELSALVDYLKNTQVKPQYEEEVTQFRAAPGGSSTVSGAESSDDTLFREAVKVVCEYDRASASLLQRRLKIGYSRAARLLDEMESRGIVGPVDGSKPREVLIHDPFAAEASTGEEVVGDGGEAGDDYAA
ncbi:MAG: DNA translocase FtsK [Patescibacteria group bacterium]|nr:DNA translocase FtsK [Patescibacteria group bacterium]